MKRLQTQGLQTQGLHSHDRRNRSRSPEQVWSQMNLSAFELPETMQTPFLPWLYLGSQVSYATRLPLSPTASGLFDPDLRGSGRKEAIQRTDRDSECRVP